jgi:hypothetical protein
MSLSDSCSSLETLSTTISNGTSLTGTINLGGFRLFGIVVPSSWTTANLSFQVSTDGGSTWANMQDQQGNEIVAVATMSNCTVLNPVSFAAVQCIRVRSGTSGTPVMRT